MNGFRRKPPPPLGRKPVQTENVGRDAMKKIPHREPLPVRLGRVHGNLSTYSFYGWTLAVGCPYCGQTHRYLKSGSRRGEDPRSTLLTLHPWMQCQEEKAREARRNGEVPEETMGYPLFDCDPQRTEAILWEDGEPLTRAYQSGVWLDLLHPSKNSTINDPIGDGLRYIWLEKQCGLCGNGHYWHACPVGGDPMEFLNQVHLYPDCRPGRSGVILRIFHDADSGNTERVMESLPELGVDSGGGTCLIL